MKSSEKIVFLAFTLLCFIAVGVCCIVNYAIDQAFTWAFYPILSVPFGFLVLTPALFRKYTASLCVSTAAVFPFLYFLDRITSGPDWFWKLGLPCAVVGAVFVWILYVLFRFVKINAWYKAAISFLLAGAAVNPIIDFFVDRFSGTETSLFNLLINLFSSLTVSALFGIIGYMKSCQENRQTVTEEEEERHRFTQRKGKEAELSKKSAGM